MPIPTSVLRFLLLQGKLRSTTGTSRCRRKPGGPVCHYRNLPLIPGLQGCVHNNRSDGFLGSMSLLLAAFPNSVLGREPRLQTCTHWSTPGECWCIIKVHICQCRQNGGQCPDRASPVSADARLSSAGNLGRRLGGAPSWTPLGTVVSQVVKACFVVGKPRQGCRNPDVESSGTQGPQLTVVLRRMPGDRGAAVAEEC